MPHHPVSLAAVLSAVALAAAPAIGAVDPAGDFLSTYTGAPSADLDWLSTSVTRRPDGIDFSATLAGAIGTTPGAVYVWGVNRGSGTARFAGGMPAVGADMLFDSVVVAFPAGEVRVVLFRQGPPAITILPTPVAIDGNRLSLRIPSELLPSTGFAVEDYRYSLWTRNRIVPGVDSGNFELADLIGENGGFTANVPEPASWAMMIAGFGLVGTIARRRRTTVAA